MIIFEFRCLKLFLFKIDSTSPNKSQTSQGPSRTLSANKYLTKRTTTSMQNLITNTLPTQSKLISKMFALISNSNESIQQQIEMRTTRTKSTSSTPPLTTTITSSSLVSTLNLLTSPTMNTYEYFDRTVSSRNLDSSTKTVDNILILEPDSLDYTDFLESLNNANEMRKNVSLKINSNEQSYTSSSQSCFTWSFCCFLFCFLLHSSCLSYFLKFI
jgi:hypothetical protein